MFCEKCGKQINPGEAFCSGCGAPLNGAPLNGASSGSKLKSTFKGSMAPPTSNVSYNPTPVSRYEDNPNPDIQQPTADYTTTMVMPEKTAPSYSQPLEAPKTYGGGYTQPVAPAPTTPSAPAYSGSPVQAPAKKAPANNAAARLAIAAMTALFALFLPVYGIGFFPDNYAMGIEFLGDVLENFGSFMDVATENFSVMAEFLTYVAPIGMLICCLLKSRIGNLLFSALGVGCCTYILTQTLFDVGEISSRADLSYFDVLIDASGLSMGFYLIFALFIIASTKSKQD